MTQIGYGPATLPSGFRGSAHPQELERRRFMDVYEIRKGRNMMPRRTFDRIVVVDVEATCWAADPPPDQTSEIIEIGVCILDVANGERLDRKSILVRPTQSSVSAFCTQHA